VEETLAPMSNEDAAQELRLIEMEFQRRYFSSFKNFIEGAWKVLEGPDAMMSWNWHLDVLATDAEEIIAGRILREIINVPPGTMKSLMMSVCFRAYIWTKDPGARFLSGSYGSHLSIRDNVKLRELVTSDWYQTLWPKTKISGDVNAKERFETTAGGWSIATSVGGVGTGEHPDYIIIDDPVTAQQALSETERKEANLWLDRTLSTRGISRNARTVLIMQRLHMDDPTAHLLRQGGWAHRCFPMEYIPKREAVNGATAYTPDPGDRRTKEGEPLWPSLFSQEKLQPMKTRLGPFGTAGQLQQQPTPEGGGLFKREWFKYLDAIPRSVRRRVRGWDTAATEDGGDYTVGVRISELHNGCFVVEDVVREQLGPAGVDALILSTAEADNAFATCPQREEKEGGSAGAAVIVARAKLLNRFDYRGVTISGNKIVRAKPFRSQCEAGNVFLVRREWNDEYLRELSNFPVGSKDDQVDGSSSAYNSLVEEPAAIEEIPTGVGERHRPWEVGSYAEGEEVPV